MAILTELELPIYAPTVTLTGDRLLAQIDYAQSIAEGFDGANRPIEKTTNTEILFVNGANARLTLFPVISITRIDSRIGNIANAFGRRIPLSDWKELTIDDYIFDDSTRLITLNHSASEIKAIYEAGFDFSSNTPEVRQLKISFGKLLEYVSSPQFAGLISGEGYLQKVTIDGQYSKWFGDGLTNNLSPPMGLLMPFKKYRPLGYATL